MLDSEFAQAVRDVEAAALGDFVRGDAASFKDLWSHTDDVTIFGGYGAHEQGWDQVGPRVDWAAARFPHATGGTYEALAADSSGELSYAIGIERCHATARTAPTPRRSSRGSPICSAGNRPMEAHPPPRRPPDRRSRPDRTAARTLTNHQTGPPPWMTQPTSTT